MSEVRVRFAPSPTGHLHIGGARTAVFNWIFARNRGGKFLLRIEDTDKARSKQEYFDPIISSLEWLGLDHDEEIFIQSEKINDHKSAAEKLLSEGKAYKCFCTPEELDERRKLAQSQKLNYFYDRTCLNLTEDRIRELEADETSFTIRCLIPEGETVVQDLVHGKTVFRNEEIEDFVILRRDGSPTYMLAVVSDDHSMGITHVIRGDDHLSNTPKQIVLYNAFGWDVPEFGHMPIILGEDKSRLSKRHGAVSVETYRERGYLSEAVCNYLTLLGWSPGNDREIISMSETVELFDFRNSQNKSLVFDEQKLLWMNGQYISTLSLERLASRIIPYLDQDSELKDLVETQGSDYLSKVLELSKQRLKLLPDFITYCSYYYRDPVTFDPKASKKHWKHEDTTQRIARIRLNLLECNPFTEENIEKSIRYLAEELELSAAKLIHPTRLAITGFGVSPGLFEVIELLGRDTVIRRLEYAVSYLEGAK